MATFAGGQTYDPGSAGQVKLPNVPEAQMAEPLPINYPDWSIYGPTAAPDPWDMFRMQQAQWKNMTWQYPSMVQMQLGQLPSITAAQMAASQQAFPLQLSQQQQASQAAFEEQLRQAPQLAASQFGLTSQYAPQYGALLRGEGQKTAEQLQSQLYQFDPEFMANYQALGGRIGEGLEAGYDLGTDLEREVSQSLRGAQAARGNYMGPAATAAEAYGLGQAATNLYNTRIGQAQNFLAGPAPTDKWSGLMQQYGPAGTAMGAATPQLQTMGGMVAPTAGMASQVASNFVQNPWTDPNQMALGQYGAYNQALGQYGSTSITGQLGYNSNLIQAASVNNEGMFNMYDKQFEQFLFDQGVSQGLYSTPSTGGAGAMGMAGSVIGGVGSAVGAVGGAVAGASAGAAAAICWLARAVLPERWKEVREWLFTKAPAYFRSAYIYNARRFVARGLTKADKAQIREVLEKCLR